jgi:hypothetical protein
MEANTAALIANSETIVQVASFLVGAFTSMAFVIAAGEIRL